MLTRVTPFPPNDIKQHKVVQLSHSHNNVHWVSLGPAICMRVLDSCSISILFLPKLLMINNLCSNSSSSIKMTQYSTIWCKAYCYEKYQMIDLVFCHSPQRFGSLRLKVSNPNIICTGILYSVQYLNYIMERNKI